MSKSLVRILSVCMLVGFLGFLVPINNWHALAHHHTSLHDSDHSDGLTFKQGAEKCVLCDLQMPLLFHEAVSPELTLSDSFDFLFTDYTCCELPVKSIQHKLRGPPAMNWF